MDKYTKNKETMTRNIYQNTRGKSKTFYQMVQGSITVQLHLTTDNLEMAKDMEKADKFCKMDQPMKAISIRT